MIGQDLVNMAQSRKGCAYVFGAIAPKDNPDYKGAFDCAELVSWAVYQEIKKLYGCENDNSDEPETADAGTPYWSRDFDEKKFRVTTQDIARATPGAILLRLPGDGLEGHIVISRGDGSTIEAMGKAWGVTNGKVDGRRWTHFILLNELEYTTGKIVASTTNPEVLYSGGANVFADVKSVQNALIEKGYALGTTGADGWYGLQTSAAVRKFQEDHNLVVDGEVGPKTKEALGL